MVFRKQTSVWHTKSGEKIRICDMDDTHLENTIKFLERKVKKIKLRTLAAAYCFEDALCGEMALDSIRHEISSIEESDFTVLLPDIYHSLLREKARRGAAAKRKR